MQTGKITEAELFGKPTPAEQSKLDVLISDYKARGGTLCLSCGGPIVPNSLIGLRIILASRD